jgi:voltage-gated potassium channel
VVTVVGDATDESNLRAAGIDRARALVAAADSDVENTYIVLTARALNPRLFIVARAGSETAERRMRAAGADRVVSPYRLGGRRMAMSAAHPTLSDVMEHVDSRRTSDAIVAEIELRDPLSPLIGVTIGVALPVDVRVMGLDRDETGLLVDPSPDTTLQADDRLFVYGTPAAVERFAANAGSRAPAPGEIRART